ncbi:tRNA (adenosine(37)-N6)-threonylcarbamoyltransferase complex dimerization subunit type 1 TsaB [Candidatus Poribacteria bacterium]|nr:tRNA (adenosine(37)-N6)-threonylcarbamoyltransferase complex dimerization subunit type 1 TsaB [Candidatus Poribacteria bacterium]MYG08357.1 tRNA (adenosine(37)-N6)-threonylcarbamoyltransferase complex dimerization subunit type 1 TsaB [Candidatus Poribacteria bacterium]MYK24235.1 tRNA (adenosine(37)-N6)-threonylcarbamoyltransferase complex dimerization subunit type 1 TsaB [Candidatus Poribacteria bacterium]
MKILGIDTSTPIGSVALIDGDNLAAEHTLNIVQAHSSRLMPAIDTVLKWSDITAVDLDGCAVGIGPGSFTGIRIGVATIKSLCYALEKPIVGVSTLEAVAYNLRWTNGIICPLLDARRNEVYGAIFEGGTEWQRLSEDLCLSLDAFLDRLDTYISPEHTINFVGDGLLTYAEVVHERLGEKAYFADAIFNVPRGATIAHLGAQRLHNGDIDDYWTLVPNYVRVGLY